MGDLIFILYFYFCKMIGVLEEGKFNVIINIKGFDCVIFIEGRKSCFYLII